MKKTLLFTLLLIFAISLTACSSNSVEKNSSKSKSSSSKKISQEDGEAKIMDLMEQMENGEISKDEYVARSKEIKNNIESTETALKKANDNISDFKGLPSWARKVGIVEPKGLTIIPEESSIMKANKNYPDSFASSYKGDKKAVFSEVKRITENLGLNIDIDLPDVYMASGEVDIYTVNVSTAKSKNVWNLILSASDLSEQGKIKDNRNK